MFTTIDKALAALIVSGLLSFAASKGINLGLTPEQQALAISFISGLLVYLVPNKKKA